MRYQACSSTPSRTSSFDTDFNSFEKEPSLAEEAAARAEAYRQLENLDFQSAAMILSTTPPKRKKFGLDFHLVQLFFTLLPSLAAVYLVAQYARSEIRKMKAEAEKKRKKAEEEDKAKKDAESASAKEEWSNELSEVKVRLGELEEAVKVIVDEKKKKLAHSDPNSAQNASSEKADPITEKAQNDTMQLKDKAQNDTVQHKDKAQNDTVQHKDKAQSDTVQHKDKAQNGIIQHKDASVNPAG